MDLPAYVEIAYDSRSLDIGPTSIKQKFVVALNLDPDNLVSTVVGTEIFDASDDALALEIAYTIFPDTRLLFNQVGDPRLLVLSSINMTQVSLYSWRLEASYEYDVDEGKGGSRPPEGEIALEYVKLNFNIGGGTRHITQSHEVTDTALATGAPAQAWLAAVPPTGNAIGATEEEVTGADVPDNTFRVQITGYYLPSAITLAYMNILKTLAGRYNNDVFLGAAAGEVLFISASGGGSVVDIIPITFDFLLSENLSAVPDPPFPSLTMLGHDLVDYKYFSTHDAASKTSLKFPMVRHVHRVAHPGDFSAMGLPV